MMRVALKDDEVTIYPIRATNSKGNNECYSFVGIPNNAKPRFLPMKARELGCIPNIHFKPLSNMQSVTLENGDVVLPEMVTDVTLPSNAFALIFLPNEDYIQSFIQDNQALFDHLQKEAETKKFRTSLVYHSMPLACVMNPIYRQEFMSKFGGDVTHILDCPESNREEYARSKAFSLSHMIKQICPLLIPVTEQDLVDHSLQKR